MDQIEYRSHQQEMCKLSDRVIAGNFQETSITLDCTPGGGKTGAGTVLVNKLLDAGHINGVLWIVPRLSLAEQVVNAFAIGCGSRNGRCLEVVDAQDNLFSPFLPNMPRIVGCVTTYQSIAHKKNYVRFRDSILDRRILVIFDEIQFLNDEYDDGTKRGWYAKAKHIKDAAILTLIMSGTLWRTDNKRIPFVTYLKGDGSQLRPHLELNYPQSHIEYTFRDAVAQQAILPTEWRNRGGQVSYTYNGMSHEHDLLDDNDDEESRKVRTFLSAERAVGDLLNDMVDDWRDWCKRVYHSRMIVMAEDVSQARKWKHYLESRHKIPCVLATCKEEAAGRKLRHFRERRHGQCLITVAMAYVGFDCPDLTHLAYLSPTRAPSWMLQSFARISHFDRAAPVDYDHQHAFVYAPDDERMRRFMDWLRQQQAMGVADRRGRTPPGPHERVDPQDEFDPLGATSGGVAVESLYRRIDPVTQERLEAFARKCPAASQIPRSQLFEILASAGFDLTKVPPPEVVNGNAPC